MPKKLTHEEFIAKAIDTWGDAYDLSQVRYEKARKKVTVVCREHGPFDIWPNNFTTQKHGCRICGDESNRRFKSIEDLIVGFREKHGTSVPHLTKDSHF